MGDALATLSGAGVSVWLDDISRERLRSGNLQDLIDGRHVVGVTSNPTIFQKALDKGDAYDAQLRDLAARNIEGDDAIRLLMGYDIRWACDVLRPVFDETGGRDGRVSIEVDPRLAHDTERTIAEARGLWWLVDRPNVMIKIPATEEGMPAITAATAEGISVNVTLIFGLDRYEAVMDAYLTGLVQARENGIDLSTIRSVASFFVSRVDTEVDKRLDKLGSDEAKALRGKAAVANARLAYQRYEKVIESDRWQALAADGAHVQRPLWASTGVKDPAYDDTMYVAELIAPDTVNTMPEKTMKAYGDHGEAGTPVQKSYEDAAAVLKSVADAGVDLDDVFQVLEDEGVQKFVDAWDELTDSIKSELEKQK